MDNELYHYGVRGMRWGVRRNTKLLGSSDSAKSAKAAEALKKHREKGSAEIAKLKKRGVELERRSEQRVINDEARAARLMNRAANHERRATRFLTTRRAAERHMNRAYVLNTRAKQLTARANEAKARVNANAAMIKAFEREIGNIDRALADRGKRYIS